MAFNFYRGKLTYLLLQGQSEELLRFRALAIIPIRSQGNQAQLSRFRRKVQAKVGVDSERLLTCSKIHSRILRASGGFHYRPLGVKLDTDEPFLSN